MRSTAAMWIGSLGFALTATVGLASGPLVGPETRQAVTRSLEATHGADQGSRISRGVRQVADRWWEQDGDSEAFAEFCEANFLTDAAELQATFERLQHVVEQIDGHLHELRRELTRPVDLDTGDIRKVDRFLSEIDLASHVDDNLFRSKVAFLALLNFPVHTLDQRLKESAEWDRQTWARSRMMDRFARRVPASVTQAISTAFTRADQYIASYNIRMDRLVDESGERPFPEGLRLITHWGLRDELKSRYAEVDGLDKQRLIYRVMQHIVNQRIPEQVVDNPDLLWSPATGDVWKYDDGEPGPRLDAPREPDTRYRRWLDIFRAVCQADPYSPTAPTFMSRRFDLDREIPEPRVEALLVSVLSSREFADTAKLIRERLGRPLEPFDIWYDGFGGRGGLGEAELDRMVGRRYPDVDAFQSALPRILNRLGFSEARSAWLAERIAVDPSRGAGHAMGAVRREDRAHLRTRFGPDGMDYKGYNIAIHELGHNVEQVFSLNGIDHWWLNGVPNTAFTEALAFVFQNRDLELLGIEGADAGARNGEALDTLWGTAEIGGVALVDMAAWRWMYEHPDATPAQLREATVRIARDVWNRHFADAFGVRDSEILAVYSHMIAFGLYLPDYPIGHIIAFQVADALRAGSFGKRFETMARQGRLTPDAWMRGAVGEAVSARALLAAARRALGTGATTAAVGLDR